MDTARDFSVLLRVLCHLPPWIWWPLRQHSPNDPHVAHALSLPAADLLSERPNAHPQGDDIEGALSSKERTNVPGFGNPRDQRVCATSLVSRDKDVSSQNTNEKHIHSLSVQNREGQNKC